MSRKKGRRRVSIGDKDDDEGTLDSATASKLFSHLLCHDEVCGLELLLKRLSELTGRNVAEKEALDFISLYPEKFLVKTVDGKKFIEAKTAVELCDSFQKGKCGDGSCPQLHICRFFLLGSCKFGDECKNDHSFNAPETRNLLAQHKLQSFSCEVLRRLFKKVLDEKITRHASQVLGAPRPCSFYNQASGCKNGDKCQFLHVCEHFVNGDCKFGKQKCKRVHDFDTAHSKEILVDHNLGHLCDKRQILLTLTGREGSSSSGSDNESDNGSDNNFGFLPDDFAFLPEDFGFFRDDEKPKRRSPTSAADDKLADICGFNLCGKCNYLDKCKAYHTNLPYQWQYLAPCQKSWSSFTDTQNQDIEKIFCDYEMNILIASATPDGGLSYSLDVQAMTGEMNEHDSESGVTVQIRRLSTISSVLAAQAHIFRTKWKWYWKDEHDKWHSYDDGDADTSSEKIELEYLKESGEKKHVFSSASNKYILHMDDPNNLYQQNEKYRTKRDVRRRPAKFVDNEAMKQIKDLLFYHDFC